MGDDLDRFRQQFEEECLAYDAARAKRETQRDREKAYEAAWTGVFVLLHRLEMDPDSPVDLEPLENLADQLKNWERVQWLVEMADNFRDQLSRGLDTPDRSRRPELWFVNVLLCLSKSPPERERAGQLLAEMRQLGFCPFGMAGIADNVKQYVRDHLGVMEQIRKQRSAEMLMGAVSTIAELAKAKPTLRRNLTFAVWAEEQLSPAEIRDRWTVNYPKVAIGKGEAGIDRVRKGLKAAKEFLAELSSRNFDLTPQEALDRLPDEVND